MNKIKCPKCGSTYVMEQAGYASSMREGESPKKGLVVPNQCKEQNCGYEWFDKN